VEVDENVRTVCVEERQVYAVALMDATNVREPWQRRWNVRRTEAGIVGQLQMESWVMGLRRWNPHGYFRAGPTTVLA